ncbi:DUF2065 family protein [Methyloligella sp. GL2]
MRRGSAERCEATAETPESSLRVAGTLAVAIGVVVVWLVRG